VSKAQSEAANVALDPSNPMHITLPTFRMVILADEMLEHFFESSFPESFHVVEGLPSSNSEKLTTFSSLGFGGRSPVAALGPQAAGATRSLRGVLDNIVTDGMRVAAEVRKRMEEAQRDIEKNALPGQHREDDEEEDDDVVSAGGQSRLPADRRSVRSSDRDLLEGADAEAATAAEKGGAATEQAAEGRVRAGSSESAQRIVEFDA